MLCSTARSQHLKCENLLRRFLAEHLNLVVGVENTNADVAAIPSSFERFTPVG